MMADEKDMALAKKPGRAFYRAQAGRPDGGIGGGGMGGFGGGQMLGFDAEGGEGVPSREQFVETAYWNPSVVTNSEGQAVVKFRAPTALSRYEFSARGVTGADTLAGQTTAELHVKRDFFVDLKVPRSLMQGDKPRLSATVHHTGVMGKAVVRLRVDSGASEQTFPKTLELKGDGVDEVSFEPFEVPEGATLRLVVEATAGEARDELTVEVPVRPWGVPAVAAVSGSATDDRTVFVGLAPGRTYENPEMLISLSPTTRRLLVELAVGPDAYPVFRSITARCFPVAPNTTADRASELLAATSVLTYLRQARVGEAPEAVRLRERIEGLVSSLVSIQNEDGGWAWVLSESEKPAASDRMTSAHATWALAAAEPLGLVSDTGALDRAVNFLTAQFAQADPTDYETRSTLLHALSVRRGATFEQANSLNRVRATLSDVSLAYLALTFANIDRGNLASEVVGVLIPRSKEEAVEPGLPVRRYWSGQGQTPWHQGPVETTALAALAVARSRPESPELKQAVEWLLAHRTGPGWLPRKAKGAALAALSAYYGQAAVAEDRYRLVVSVNDTQVGTIEVDGAKAEGTTLRVPLKAIEPTGRNRVRFDMEGRGTFGYSVTLAGFTREFGPDQDRTGKTFAIERKAFFAAEPEFEGKRLASGFGVAVNPQYFENTITQVGLGARAKVYLNAYRTTPPGQPAWQGEFLILEETLPAGATLIEGSVNFQGSHYEQVGNVLTFYFTPDQYPHGINYEVFGYLPGEYRSLPPRLSSAYDPGRVHLGPETRLTVLEPGVKSTDPYKPTPDELYARGNALYDSGRLAEAAEPFESLWGAYTLNNDVARDVARKLLTIHIRGENPRKVVQFFEILREKAPELVLPFDDIRAVGRSYGAINEHERAYLVWKATSEASYLEDARVGEVLRQRGKPLEGLAFLLDLWREYPNSASIESDFFGLSQLVGNLANQSLNDAAVRRSLLDAGVSRTELLMQSARLAQVFLAQSPRNPIADEASLALVNSYMDLEDFRSVVQLAEQYTKLYPKSKFLDSFQYAEALGRFNLGEYDRAIAVAETIAKATYKDESGAEVPSPNKWQALFILGQIYDARRQPAKALEYYQQVADRFTDASGAVRALERENLKLPEVSVIRPKEAPKVAARGVAGVAAGLVDDKAQEPKVKLDYRNIAEADVKVYPVDLMRLYLERRNLDQITGIDLAGIAPLVETTVKLGDGKDFADKIREIALPLKDEGAYLVMIRGDNLYTSGIALVSPLEVEVLEEPEGRVRVMVRDAQTGDPAPKVQVKVIGSQNGRFQSGETDLRGVFSVEGIQGTVTAVARQGTARYAFYRGTEFLGARQEQSQSAAEPQAAGAQGTQGLNDNLRMENASNQQRQIERLQQRYNLMPGKGVQLDKTN
jgi:hypothetical protein